MPYIHIRVGTELNNTQRTSIFERTTELMSSIMGKKRAVTVVQIEEQAPYQWSVAGKTLTRASRTPAYVDIKITEGTNTSAEKSAMIAAAADMLQETIGPVQEACYVVIHDVDSDAWGYDGKTQATRASPDLQGTL